MNTPFHIATAYSVHSLHTTGLDLYSRFEFVTYCSPITAQLPQILPYNLPNLYFRVYNPLPLSSPSSHLVSARACLLRETTVS